MAFRWLRIFGVNNPPGAASYSKASLKYENFQLQITAASFRYDCCRFADRRRSADREAQKARSANVSGRRKSWAGLCRQGEYSNDWGGAQVIALGDSRFRLVIYQGGFPGAGWDQGDKTTVEGKREDDKINFAAAPNGFKHSLADGTLTTATPNGDEYKMKKIQRTSPALGAKPPTGAIVLYDGSNVDAWNNAHIDSRGLLAAGATTKQKFTNFTLHAEFFSRSSRWTRTGSRQQRRLSARPLRGSGA